VQDPELKPNHGWLALVLLAALCCFHAGVNVWWLSADNHVIRTDEESHMHYARQYYSVFSLRTFDEPFDRLVALSNIRPDALSHPPLLHVLGGALLSLFGYSVDVMALTNTLCFLVMLLGVYLIARQLLSPLESVFVTAVVSLGPLIFAASRYFMTDYLSMTLVVWAIYALIRSRGFLCTNWVTVFAILNGLGFLARSITFVYYLVPLGLVIGAGAFHAIAAPGRSGVDWALLRKLFFHGVITVFVTFGIALPWYTRHMEDIYDYWTKSRASSTGAPIALGAASPRPEPAASPTTDADAGPGPSEAQSDTPAEPSLLAGLVERLRNPPNPWPGYPVHVINNGLFLPLVLLSVAGMLLVWLHPRFRRWQVFLLLAWILGAWVMMQLLVRWSTPRHALQALPAMAMFAGLLVLAIPGRTPRNVAGALLLLWLGLQFFHLSVMPLAPLNRIEIPVVLSERYQNRYDDPGLVVIKDTIAASDAFRRISAPVEENYKDRIFEALVRAETKGPVKGGEFADYGRLHMLGMEFDEKHYWPDPNPFLTEHAAGLPRPRRKLRSVAMARGQNMGPLRPYLPGLEYVVYRAWSEERERAWLSELEEAGFRAIFRYSEPRIGADPAATYGVVAKGVEEMEVHEVDLADAESVQGLDFYALHELLNSPAYAQAPATIRRAARERYDALLEQFDAFPLNDAVQLLNADITPLPGRMLQMRYTFRVVQDMGRDYEIYLVGWVPEERFDLLPQEQRDAGLGYFKWDYAPTLPTSRWPRGSVRVVTQKIDVHPIQYQFLVGLQTPNGEIASQGAQLGVHDLRDVLLD